MRQCLIILILFVQGAVAISQPKSLPDIEDLKRELILLKGIKYIDMANQISWTYGMIGTPKFLQRADSILKYATLASTQAKKTGYKKGLAQAYLNIASSFKIRAVGLRISNADEIATLDEGINYLVNALNLGKELKNDEITADALWQLKDEFLITRPINNKNLLEQIIKNNPVNPVFLYQRAGNKKSWQNRTPTWGKDFSLKASLTAPLIIHRPPLN